MVNNSTNINKTNNHLWIPKTGSGQGEYLSWCLGVIVRWLSLFAMSFYILYLHVIKKKTTEIWYKQSKHIKIQYNMSQLNHLTCKNYNR